MITHTPFVLPNGYELTYHEVWQKDVDLYNCTLTILIGSWANEEIKHASNFPEKITEIKVKYNSWSPEYLENVDLTVMTHPEWTGSSVKPSSGHIWNPIQQVWIAPPEKPLSEVKELKWQEIKQARSTQEFGGFTWDGSLFDSTPVSVQRINGAVTLCMLNSSLTLDWTLADNTVRNLTATQIIAVGIALGTHVNFCHEKARLLRTQIESATTAAAVASITW